MKHLILASIALHSLTSLAAALPLHPLQGGPARPAAGGNQMRAAVPKPVIPDCAAVDLVPARVLLTWPDVPTEDTLAAPSGGTTQLLVQNVGTEAVTYDLEGLFVADGQRLDLSLGSGSLAPDSATTVPVTLSSYGVSLFDLDFSGSLFVQTAVRDSSGVLLERAYSPAVFFHQDPTGAVFLYGRQARHDLFFAGDLKNRFFSSTPPDTVMGVFDGGVGVGSDAEDYGPPDGTTPANNGQWEFCMRWVYESVDSGFGEDHYQQGMYMKARGMRVVVDHPNWAFPVIFHGSQDNGCFTFPSNENTGFEVTIYAEAVLGSKNDVILRTFDSKGQANADDLLTWHQVVNPGGVPRRIYLQNEVSDESSLMAFGSFVFHWVDSHTEPGLEDATLRLMTDNPACEGSCQPENEVQMRPGASNRKFLVGHEVGHWIHRRWSGSLLLYENTYEGDAGGAFCEFDGVGNHAMRSREYALGAFTEGLAHFISALAWNDHGDTEGWFKYYKEVDGLAYEDLQADNWRVDLEGNGNDPSGGVSAWMETMCDAEAGYSVEMDWLRFYWDYRTVSAVLTPVPTHYEILRHAGYARIVYGWGNSNVYPNLLNAIDDVALGQVHEQRFETFADINGVDY